MPNNSNISQEAAGPYTTGEYGRPWLRSSNHASKLYSSNNSALTPKSAFLYYVYFNINKEAKLDGWDNLAAGLLAKNVQLPKFKIATETINQYNRKTNIQTKLNYEPVKLEFHDDMASNTTGLWKNYFKYYYTDPNYSPKKNETAKELSDTKFGTIDYQYGYQNAKQKSFFTSIDIFVLHQNNYTKMSLINPLITSWEHDSLDQENGSKFLKNSMSLMYEDVFYQEGTIGANAALSDLTGLANTYRDNTPSTLIYGAPNLGAHSGSVLEEADFRPPLDVVKPPSTGELSKSLLAIGSTLRAVGVARQLLENPRLAWQVYGFNPKNVLTNAFSDAVFAAAASVTSEPLPEQNQTFKNGTI